MTAKIMWEYEDKVECKITKEMFERSIVRGVRLYPYVVINEIKYYLE